MRRRRDTSQLAGIALALVAATLLAGLGVWQLERRAEKLALIERTRRKLAAAPAPLPAPRRWAGVGRDQEYTRVRIAGSWRSGRPAFVHALTDDGPGWWVMQPLASAAGTVLVNRGFVTSAERGRAAVPPGPVVVTGLLRLSEPGGRLLRRNDPARDVWYSRDVAAIARSQRFGPVAPFFIDADASPASAAGPRGGLAVVAFPNNHLVYAVTWFALAGMAAGVAWRIARPPAKDQVP